MIPSAPLGSLGVRIPGELPGHHGDLPGFPGIPRDFREPRGDPPWPPRKAPVPHLTTQVLPKENPKDPSSAQGGVL